MPRHLAWLLTLGALALPSSALASKVEVVTGSDCHGDIACDKYAGGQPVYALSFLGTAAETNDVKVTLEPDGGHILVSDAGAPLTPGTRCTARDDHAAVCDVSGYPLTGSTFVLGAGSDRFTIGADIKAGVSVDAGAGDDEVSGGVGADTLTGGPGLDKLVGGDGNDLFPAGESADSDVIDGGAGTNTADYRARKNELRVNLGDSSASQGEPGENDTLTQIKNVYGGGGDDSLGGDGSANRLDGGGGDDAIAGGGGNDSLIGGAGLDQIDAGGGNDYIDAHDMAPDTISCGPGMDEIGSLELEGEYLDEPLWLGPDAKDRLAADCESVWLGGWRDADAVAIPIQMRRRGSIVTLANPCRVSEIRRGCKGTVRIGKRSKRGFSAKAKRVSLRLGRKDRGAARKGPVRLSILLRTAAGKYRVDLTTTPAAA
jgi:RTX calcium-binding nonapeptide repeat (4 copies)